jgi:protease IV
MIDDASATSLIPNLISLLKGNQLPKASVKFPVVYFDCDDDDCDNDDYDNDLNELEEINISSENQYVAVLPIKGTIFKYDQECGPKGTQTMIAILNNWKNDSKILGVILDTDSGGGQASGTRELRELILNYPKPIVTYSNGNIGSAAYWLASASKYIVLNENADFTGSIGAMLKYVNLDGILKNQGATIEDLYADGSPRKNEEVRAIVDKQDSSILIKNVLNPLQGVFAADVKISRPQLSDSVFEGAIYFPKDALAEKLVDQFGTMKTAFDKVIELSKSNKINNHNNNTMQTKQLPKLQAVLGLTAALAMTDNGSYLNAEQLDNLENRIDALETSEANLQTQLAEAQNNTALQTELSTATGAIASLETSVDAILEEAGLTATGNITEKITALSAKVTEMAGKDGANHTATRVDPKQSAGTPNYVDANAGHNQLANEMFNPKK